MEVIKTRNYPLKRNTSPQLDTTLRFYDSFQEGKSGCGFYKNKDI